MVLKLQRQRLFQMAQTMAAVAFELGPSVARDGDAVDPMQGGHIEAMPATRRLYRALIKAGVLHNRLLRHQRREGGDQLRELRGVANGSGIYAMQLGVEVGKRLSRVDQQAEIVNLAPIIDASEANLTNAMRIAVGGFDIKGDEAIGRGQMAGDHRAVFEWITSRPNIPKSGLGCSLT